VGFKLTPFVILGAMFEIAICIPVPIWVASSGLSTVGTQLGDNQTLATNAVLRSKSRHSFHCTRKKCHEA
jgi:hypothetical protein